MKKRKEYLPKASALLDRIHDLTIEDHNEQMRLSCDGAGVFPDSVAEVAVDGVDTPVRRYIELDFDETVEIVEESIKRGCDYPEEGHCVPLGQDWEEEHGWGGKDPAGLLRDMKHGTDSAALETVDRMVEEVGFHLDIDTPGQRVTNSLVGGSVSTPRFMQNIPTCMRRKELDINNAAPIRVVCDGSSSANVDDDSLETRSSAVLALVEVLNQHRPVEFWLASCGCPGWEQGTKGLYIKPETGGIIDWEGDETGATMHSGKSANAWQKTVNERKHYDTMTLVRVSTHPIDISLVAAAMSQAYIRRFMYGVEYFMSGRTTPDYGGHLGWPSVEAGYCMKRLPTDIVVPPLHCARKEEMLTDSVKWVADNVAKALNLEGAAYDVDKADEDEDD